MLTQKTGSKDNVADDWLVLQHMMLFAWCSWDVMLLQPKCAACQLRGTNMLLRPGLALQRLTLIACCNGCTPQWSLQWAQ